MNDSELDQLLNTWDAPAPPQSLRDGIKARFPRSERRPLSARLRWGLGMLLASGALALGMAQMNDSRSGALFGSLHHAFEHLARMINAHRAILIIAEIRHSQPQVFVDGQPAGPLDFSGAPTFAATLQVGIPGSGVYRVMLFGHETGWVEAGDMHDNVIEFDADGKQVRIECSRSIVEGERPVFVKRTQ